MLAILLFFFIAVLTGLGVGGGGLLVILLALLTDLPQLTIQGMNLFFFLLSGGSSLLIHLRKRKIFFALLLPLILCGIPGTLLGALLSSYLPRALLRKLFGTMLLITGIYSLKQSKEKEIESK